MYRARAASVASGVAACSVMPTSASPRYRWRSSNGTHSSRKKTWRSRSPRSRASAADVLGDVELVGRRVGGLARGDHEADVGAAGASSPIASTTVWASSQRHTLPHQRTSGSLGADRREEVAQRVSGRRRRRLREAHRHHEHRGPAPQLVELRLQALALTLVGAHEDAGPALLEAHARPLLGDVAPGAPAADGRKLELHRVIEVRDVQAAATGEQRVGRDHGPDHHVVTPRLGEDVAARARQDGDSVARRRRGHRGHRRDRVAARGERARHLPAPDLGTRQALAERPLDEHEHALGAAQGTSSSSVPLAITATMPARHSSRYGGCGNESTS